jgi:transcriptional regulator
MYTPELNRETSLPVLRRFLREHPLCALVTVTAEGPVASHLPMVLHEEGEGLGVLRGHLARANPQWRSLSPEQPALGIFTGPEHSISASWYPGKQSHGREVPTWNYVAVHVYGPLRVVEDPGWLMAHLRELTARSEAATGTGWQVEDAPPDFIAAQMRGIVGLELPVERVEGKWKASQNRSEADVAGIVRGLERVGTPAAAEMRSLVLDRRPAGRLPPDDGASDDGTADDGAADGRPQARGPASGG